MSEDKSSKTKVIQSYLRDASMCLKLAACGDGLQFAAANYKIEEAQRLLSEMTADETPDKPGDLKRDEKLRQVSLATIDAKLLGCGFVMILPDKSFRHVPLERIQIKPESSSVEEATAPIGAETDFKLHADMSREQVDAVMNRTAAARSSNQRSTLQQILAKFKEADEERYRNQMEFRADSLTYKAEGDMYGYNFHAGMDAGANWVALYFFRVQRELEGLIKATPDETSGQSSLRAALEEILLKAPADNWWSRDIARKALNAPHSAGMRPALTAEQKRESVKAMYDDLIGGSSGD